jgi:hypothetical protein
MSCRCGGSACGCCEGVTAQTPRPLSNTFGRSVLSYRSGTQPDFYASLIAGLSRSSRPALSRLSTRESDDTTIALLDAFACMCDVLTFYTERLAQESYLRTATDPVSLRELGRLLGYRPNPGCAAQTRLAFTLARPPQLPAALSTDPGVVPPVVPAAVDLAPGLRVMNVPGPGQQSVTFETTEAITAQPQWNSATAVRTKPPALRSGASSAWFVNDATTRSLKPGDRLLVLGNQTGNNPVYGTAVVDSWDCVVVTAVLTDPTAASDAPIRISWSSALAHDYSTAPPGVLVLRAKTDIFGARAPDWNSMSQSFRYYYVHHLADTNPDHYSEWPRFGAVTTVAANGGGLGMILDGSQPAMLAAPPPQAGPVSSSASPPGAWLLADSLYGPQLYLITGRAEAAMARYAISGPVTQVTVAGADLPPSPSGEDLTPRDVTIYGGGQLLTLADEPDTSVVGGDTGVSIVGDWSDMPAGHTLVVSGTTTSPFSFVFPWHPRHPRPTTTASEVVTLSAAPAAPANEAKPVTYLMLTTPLANSYVRDSVVVYGNIAQATHGSSVSQILGNGTAAAGQTLQINTPPITYVPAATTSGTASTLDVTVDDLTWTEVPALYPHGPHDHVFTTDLDAAGNITVVFGDGARGARPATGSLNIRASYRHNLGVAGNLNAQALSNLVDRPLGVTAVANPVPATGGVDPQTPDAARASIPLPVRTLGRAVSVQDYADYALAFTGVAKANATVLPAPHRGPTIVISVAGDNDTVPTPQDLAPLIASLQAYGDPFAEMTVLPYRPLLFQIRAKVAVAADRTATDVLAAITLAWQSAFSFTTRALQQPVFLSEVITAAQDVPGVLGVDVQSLYLTGAPVALHDRLVAAAATVGAGGALAPADLLTLDPTQLQPLTVMP